MDMKKFLRLQKMSKYGKQPMDKKEFMEKWDYNSMYPTMIFNPNNEEIFYSQNVVDQMQTVQNDLTRENERLKVMLELQKERIIKLLEYERDTIKHYCNNVELNIIDRTITIVKSVKVGV